MSMDVIASGLEPENSFSSSTSRPGGPEFVNKPVYATGQSEKLPNWSSSNDSAVSNDPTSASSSSHELETARNDDGCDKMVEKWRLIRLADRNGRQKKIYSTNDVHTALFGKNYSNFYEAFQKGISTPQTPKPTATTVPAKRSAAASKQASKRRKQDDRVSLPHPDQHQARTEPVQRQAATTTKTSMGAKATEIASPLDVARESLVTPRPRSQSEAKEQSSRRKGVGLYAGNWEYVTDEEKVPEYLSVAQKIADLEGRTTRRAYAKMTSMEGAGDSGRLFGSSPGSEVRKSGRARNAVDYTRPSGSEENAREIVTPKQIEAVGTSPGQEINQMSHSTSTSSTSDRSTSMPDHPSRPSSTSTAMNTEQPERPNLSWNAIVYGVLATSETPLTFLQLVQEIKKRYPFFNSPSQVKVLKSGPKNPLYFHEAFCKGGTINGKQTWALRPGKFVDKKTGEVLTPQPRHTVSSPRLTEQAHETEDQSPSNMVSKPSQSYNPRFSTPRFGREILNSPEIPDSQDERAITPIPQAADSRVATEHAPHLESPYQHTPATSRFQAHELADAANATSANAFIATNSFGYAPQPNSQWATMTGSPKNTTSTDNSPTSAGTNIQKLQNIGGEIDHEASELAAKPLSALQAAQPPTSSIPSSTGESAHDSSSSTTQAVSTSVPLMYAVSPTSLPTLLGESAFTSQTPNITPAMAKSSVTPLVCTQHDGFLPDGKAGAKEMHACTCNDGSV